MPITANYIYNLHTCPWMIAYVYVGTWVVFYFHCQFF